MRLVFPILSVIMIACSTVESDDTEEISSELVWNSFDQAIFDQAKEENKLVLLDVGANWCHWCHVMDEETYADPEVIEFLNKNFVLAREDQDERPDLYAAYRSHGWPATVVFNAEGGELRRFRGFMKSKRFIRRLQEVVDNPVMDDDLFLSDYDKAFRPIDSDSLFQKYVNNLNHEIGGYKSAKMQLHKEGLEFGLLYGHKDDRLKAWTDLTYTNSFKLVDSVWGGVSQYSDSWVWENDTA